MIPFVLDSMQIIASAAVAVALYFTIRTFRGMRRMDQIKLGENFHSGMQQLRRQIAEYFEIKENKELKSKLKVLDEMIFKTLEWNAFLIRTKKMNDKALIRHFKKDFIEWHDNVFGKVIENKDKSKYEQFQELVRVKTREI
jgi:hypothetical protein